MTKSVQRLMYGALVALFAAGLAWAAAAPAARASASPRPFRNTSGLRTAGAAVPPALREAIDRNLGEDWLQQTEFADPHNDADAFGYAVALSADGTVALVGAPDYESAYIFVKMGNSWSQVARLTASDGQLGDYFGTSVALSAAGNVAVVGSEYGYSSGIGAAAYVFTSIGDVWTQSAELHASDGATGNNFGYAVALSADGTAALIGAPGYGGFAGATYVFDEAGGTWTQTTEFTAPDGGQDLFGESVALSAEGTTALVGSLYGDNHYGAAWVFAESGGTWAQTAELLASDGVEGDAFGETVALSGDGVTALVGAGDHNAYTGAAYVFTNGGGTWIQTAELTANDGAPEDGFGDYVALSSDDTTALISAPGHMQGVVYSFIPSIGTTGDWTQTAELTAGDENADEGFSDALALSLHGLTALIGAPYHLGEGAAYVFAEAKVLFNPTSGPSGSTTHLVGAGFTPYETVDLSIGGLSGQVQSNGSGRFNIALRVPNVPPHTYNLTATGESNGLTAQATFTVTASGPRSSPFGPSDWIIRNR